MPVIEDNDADLIDIGEDTEIATVEKTEETEPEVTTRTLYTTSKVNIREQPNTDCAVLGKAESGQEVIEYEAGADGWSRVACGGVEGYIKSEFLTQEAPNTATTQAAEPTASVAAMEPVQNTPAPEATAVVASVPETPVAVAPVPEPVTAPVTTSASGGSGGYIYNTSRGTLHRASCSHLPEEQNRMYLNTLEEAMAQNPTKSCGYCHPY